MSGKKFVLTDLAEEHSISAFPPQGKRSKGKTNNLVMKLYVVSLSLLGNNQQE